MKYLTKSFWNLSHDCKWDALQEPQHTHIIHRALRDYETNIEWYPDGTCSLYGKQEALLIIPQLLNTKILLGFYSLIKLL